MILLTALFMLSGPISMVHDGNTFHVAGDRVRLADIDAPELDQTCTRANGDTYAAGKVYRAALLGLMRDHAYRCEWQHRDKYHRPVVTCFTDGDGISLNERMVLSGYAFASDYPKAPSPYQHDEELAEQARVGVWNGSCERPWKWKWRREHQHE